MVFKAQSTLISVQFELSYLIRILFACSSLADARDSPESSESREEVLKWTFSKKAPPREEETEQEVVPGGK